MSLNYDKAIHCIRGPDVTIYDSRKHTNVTDAVRDALHNITDRQATKRGVTILCGGYVKTSDIIKSVTEVSDKTPICYLSNSEARDAGVKSVTEKEITVWLNDRGNINLITTIEHATGWEDYTVIVIDDDGYSLDNMCLRTVSTLHIIKYKDINSQRRRR